MDKNEPFNEKVFKEKSLEKATEKTMGKYNRFSYIYDLFESPMENSVFKKWRADLINPLRGNILEVGVGTGKNLEYYNKMLYKYIFEGLAVSASAKTKIEKAGGSIK